MRWELISAAVKCRPVKRLLQQAEQFVQVLQCHGFQWLRSALSPGTTAKGGVYLYRISQLHNSTQAKCDAGQNTAAGTAGL